LQHGDKILFTAVLVIFAFFARSVVIAASSGIARENIVLDPGIVFGKTH
jgi:dihydropteroate synthase